MATRILRRLTGLVVSLIGMLQMMLVALMLSLQAPVTTPGRSDDESGVTGAGAAMQILEPIVGSFTLTAGETATDGSAFKETGIRECRWMFDRAAILCEDRRTLVEATGRYQRLDAHRRPAVIYRWRTEDKLFERVGLGVTGTSSVTALTQPEAGRFMWPFEVASSSFRGEALTATSELVIERDRHVIKQELRSRVSNFGESYSETATRTAMPTPLVALEGDWSTEATHLRADGSRDVERGAVSCRLIADRSFLHCERRHVDLAGNRRTSVQVWTPDGATGYSVVTITAGRPAPALQRASTSDGGLRLTGPLRDGRATRAELTVAPDGALSYRSETEEAPGKWWLDFIEM